MAAVVERWTVPTMLTPGELARLSATACLTIAEDGTLTSFRIVEPSGNSFFDGSLLSTLGQLKQLPKPHGRFARAALNGKLCPSFSKQ
jgi:TonB family protein